MITHEDFYKLAKEFSSENKTNETERRNIIHLLYYYFYHQCVRLIKLEYPDLKNRNYIPHKEIVQILSNYLGDDIFLQQAKKYFTSIRQYRVNSDYCMLTAITENDLDYVIEMIECCRNC